MSGGGLGHNEKRNIKKLMGAGAAFEKVFGRFFVFPDSQGTRLGGAVLQLQMLQQACCIFRSCVQVIGWVQ